MTNNPHVIAENARFYVKGFRVIRKGVASLFLPDVPIGVFLAEDFRAVGCADAVTAISTTERIVISFL